MKTYSSFGLLAAGAVRVPRGGHAGLRQSRVVRPVILVSGHWATSTQTDRLNRGGVPQDFSGTEAYPGTNTTAINVSGTFNYITITLTPAQLAGGPYVQVELDTQGPGTVRLGLRELLHPA